MPGMRRVALVAAFLALCAATRGASGGGAQAQPPVALSLPCSWGHAVRAKTAELDGAVAARAGTPATPPSPIDITRPDSWDASVGHRQEALRAAVAELMRAALDRASCDEGKRRAVLALGSVGDARSVGFLVANVTLVLPLDLMMSDGDQLLEHPCTYALMGIHDGKRHWGAVPLILHLISQPAALKEPATIDCARVLRRICGQQLARALVAQALSEAKDPVAKANIEKVRHYVD